MKIKKGKLFVFTNGEYSDYELMTICRAVEDLDMEALLEEYLKLNPEQKERFKFRSGTFVKWVIVDKRMAKELDYQECHLGGYNDLGEIDWYQAK